MKVASLLQDIPAELPDEFIELLARGPGVRIERIVSRGHCSPPDFWYDQEEAEWVLLLKGAARLRFADPDRVVELQPGMHVTIDAHERHRVEWTAEEEDTVWVAVFYRGAVQAS